MLASSQQGRKVRWSQSPLVSRHVLITALTSGKANPRMGTDVGFPHHSTPPQCPCYQLASFFAVHGFFSVVRQTRLLLSTMNTAGITMQLADVTDWQVAIFRLSWDRSRHCVRELRLRQHASDQLSVSAAHQPRRLTTVVVGCQTVAVRLSNLLPANSCRLCTSSVLLSLNWHELVSFLSMLFVVNFKFGATSAYIVNCCMPFVAAPF